MNELNNDGLIPGAPVTFEQMTAINLKRRNGKKPEAPALGGAGFDTVKKGQGVTVIMNDETVIVGTITSKSKLKMKVDDVEVLAENIATIIAD